MQSPATLHPSPSGTETSTSRGVPSIPDFVESALMASIRQDTQDIGIISWSLLVRETASDTALSSLLKLAFRTGDPQPCSQQPFPSTPLARLRVCVCTGGRPLVSRPRHRTLITPLPCTAEPPRSSPGNINDGTASSGHSLLARHVHGYLQHEKRMCRLQ